VPEHEARVRADLARAVDFLASAEGRALVAG
jgi:hypothetical protein